MKTHLVKIKSNFTDIDVIVNSEDFYDVMCCVSYYHDYFNSKAQRKKLPIIENNELLFDKYGNSAFKGFCNGEITEFKTSCSFPNLYDLENNEIKSQF